MISASAIPAGAHVAVSSSARVAGVHPRVRWAAIVWGVFFAALAGTALWILTAAERRAAAVSWLSTLDVSAVAVLAVLVVGVLLLVAGLSALLRRTQRPHS